MTENRVYGALLVVLMTLAYLSWHRQEDSGGARQVVLVDGRPEGLRGIELVTPTATVTVELREAEGGRYAWIEAKTAVGKRSFAGAEAFDQALGRYAKLEALRSLGRLSGDELAQTKLASRERKRLRLRLTAGDRDFVIGGTTGGSRDFYVREQGADEVFLLSNELVSDLERPEGRFMQRRLRTAPLDQVERLRLEAGGRTAEATQENRLSAKDAFWSTADKPGQVSDAWGNFVDKLERLSVVEYPPEGAAAFASSDPILTATWLGAGGKVLDRLEIRREASGRYVGLSTATRAPVELPKTAAEQIEQDRSLVFAP